MLCQRIEAQSVAPTALPSALATSSVEHSALQERLAHSEVRRLPLALVVDGVTKADNIVVMLKAHDVLVRETDMRFAEVRLPTAVFVDISGTRYVSLASLAPKITYRIDDVAIALDLQVEPSLLGHSTVAVGERRQSVHLAQADPSGFVTYSISSDTANLSKQASGFLQAGAGSAAEGLFTASASYADGAARRGLVAYQKDFEQNLSRFTIGDESASTGDLGADVVVGGFGATRHFEFQADGVYFPTPGLRGTALSPTTADVYVNGALVRSVQLAPGAFDLTGIPVPPGAGVTQVVLHDAYGNTQTLGGAYYEARQLLQKGLTDYDYHAGFVRQNPFGANDVYGPFAALGEYRIGLSNAVTAGARFERTSGIVSGGPQFDVGLPIGFLSFEADASRAADVGGHAYGAAYSYSGRKLGFGISAQTQSAHYSTASLGPNLSRQLSSVRENFGAPLSRTASIEFSNTTTTTSLGQAAGNQLVADATLKPKIDGLFLTMSAERDRGGSTLGFGAPIATQQWSINAQATFLTSKTSNVSFATSNAAGAGSSTVAISKSAPTGPGFGYDVQGTSGAALSATAQVSYQTQYVDLQALSNSGFGPSSTSMTLTGSLVAFRQGVFFTRPVSGAYSLVDVAGFAKLPVFFNGQYAGRTDGRGGMVVPNLSPYSDNEVVIDDLRNRLDLAEDTSFEEVRPKNLSGVLATFAVHAFHAYAGNIRVHRAGQFVVPVFGRLVFSHAGTDYPSDLGRKGQFYVENLPPGNYAATITTTDGLTCAFHVDLPVDKRPVTSVGTLDCEAK